MNRRSARKPCEQFVRQFPGSFPLARPALGESGDDCFFVRASLAFLLGPAGVDDPELGGAMEISQCVLAGLGAYGGAVGYFTGS